MTISETAAMLRRRWYVWGPGVVIAFLLAGLVWADVKADYTRSETELLIPGEAAWAPNTHNPYLNLGGLDQAADSLVSALQEEQVLAPILSVHPHAEIVVERDPDSAAAALRLTVTAKSDAEAMQVLGWISGESPIVLGKLQDQSAASGDARLSVHRMTVDTTGVIDHRSQMSAAATAGIATALLSLLIAAMVDALIRPRRPPARRGAASPRSLSGAAVGARRAVMR